VRVTARLRHADARHGDARHHVRHHAALPPRRRGRRRSAGARRSAALGGASTAAAASGLQGRRRPAALQLQALRDTRAQGQRHACCVRHGAAGRACQQRRGRAFRFGERPYTAVAPPASQARWRAQGRSTPDDAALLACLARAADTRLHAFVRRQKPHRGDGQTTVALCQIAYRPMRRSGVAAYQTRACSRRRRCAGSLSHVRARIDGSVRRRACRPRRVRARCSCASSRASPAAHAPLASLSACSAALRAERQAALCAGQSCTWCSLLQ
jgi:hypothetical protein